MSVFAGDLNNMKIKPHDEGLTLLSNKLIFRQAGISSPGRRKQSGCGHSGWFGLSAETRFPEPALASRRKVRFPGRCAAEEVAGVELQSRSGGVTFSCNFSSADQTCAATFLPSLWPVTRTRDRNLSLCADRRRKKLTGDDFGAAEIKRRSGDDFRPSWGMPPSSTGRYSSARSATCDCARQTARRQD